MLIVLSSIGAPALATAIDDKYSLLGGAAGFLGAPTIAETPTPDGGGSFRHFQNGSIYWHPTLGAYEVHGLIRQRWKELGWEKSYFGYPVTDEIDLIDGGGRVSRFQGGQLMWRKATNKVTELRATSLVVDPPFAPGETWRVIQTNGVTPGKDSHFNLFAYCLDMIVAGLPQSESNGRPFTAVGAGKIAYVEQGYGQAYTPGNSGPGNIVVQRLGEGRYASYLHMKHNSYSKHFGSADPNLPQWKSWADRPSPPPGAVLGEVGDSGANPGAYHMHFCVTTAPDRAEFKPFESVPFSFRNYYVSNNEGKNWSFVSIGAPANGQWIRRPTHPGEQGVQLNSAVSPLSYGTVEGLIGLTPGDGQPAGPGKFVVRIMSPWHEPLRTTTINVGTTRGPARAGAPIGPWPFKIKDVPAYKNLRISASFSGPWSKPNGGVNGESAKFELKPFESVTKSVIVKSTPAK